MMNQRSIWAQNWADIRMLICEKILGWILWILPADHPDANRLGWLIFKYFHGSDPSQDHVHGDLNAPKISIHLPETIKNQEHGKNH